MHCSQKFGKAGVSTATMAADEHMFTDDARPTDFSLIRQGGGHSRCWVKNEKDARVGLSSNSLEERCTLFQKPRALATISGQHWATATTIVLTEYTVWAPTHGMGTNTGGCQMLTRLLLQMPDPTSLKMNRRTSVPKAVGSFRELRR